MKLKKWLRSSIWDLKKIHACENDYMLFYDDDKDILYCKYNGESLYSLSKEGGKVGARLFQERS